MQAEGLINRPDTECVMLYYVCVWCINFENRGKCTFYANVNEEPRLNI